MEHIRNSKVQQQKVNPVKKWAIYFNRQFSKENIQKYKRRTKNMLSIPRHQGNVNQPTLPERLLLKRQKSNKLR